MRFEISGDGEDFSARGDLVLDGGVPRTDEWAVAADPDSVGGIVLTAYRPSAVADEGDLFVLQLRPVRTGTFAPCGPDEECHGRLLRGWRTDFTGYEAWFEVVSGSVQVAELTGSLVAGTFAFSLRGEGGAGDEELTIDEGSFRVPFDDGAGGFVCGLPPSVGCVGQSP